MVRGFSNAPHLVGGAPITQRSAARAIAQIGDPPGMQGLPSTAKASAGRG